MSLAITASKDNWMVMDENGNPISNFAPNVLACVDMYIDGESKLKQYVRLTLLFDDGISGYEFMELLDNIDNISWLRKDKRCRIHPRNSHISAKRYLADLVRTEINSVKIPKEKAYRIHLLGTTILEDIPVFNAGGQLYWPPDISNKPTIELEPILFNLDIDPGMTEEEVVADIFELISLSPNAMRVILAQSLLYIMRVAYEKAWKSPCCSVFLFGKTGVKKTTIASLITQLYNRRQGIKNPPRLNASIPAAVKIIFEKNDCVVVIDDLFPAESKAIKRKQEETFIEITRIIADGIEPGRVRGNKVAKAPPSCGVLFTGEYVVGSGSDAARLLPVELLPTPDGEKLKRFQDKPLLVSTFYHYYIKWFIANFHEILDLLKQWLEVYRKEPLGVHDRLQETHFFLNTAYALLLQYCFDKGFISEQDAKSLHRSFLALLSELVMAQQLRVEQGKVIDAGHMVYLSHISSQYKSGFIHLADSAKQFDDEWHDGIIHDGCLCLRGGKIRKLFPGILFEDIIDNLENQNALKRVNDKKTKQIYGTGGKRFYAIPLEKLK